MTPSIHGGLLPDTEQDLNALLDARRARYHRCIDCKAAFTAANVRTRNGWRETQISGMCEDCFDNLFKEPTP